MKLPFTDETIMSPDGVACRVLDTARVDFSGAATGRKTTETLVRCAQGGEKIETRNTGGKLESVYVAQKGDAVFINLHNENDIYVPGNPDGTRLQFAALEQNGFKITGDDMARGGVRVRSTAASKILHEAVEEACCIKDSWGPGKHQYLHPGATLKRADDGRVTGIDKSAFDATWEIMSTPVNGPARGRKARVKKFSG